MGRWVKNSPKTNNPKVIVFDERNAETYGAFIGARYRNKRIVWVLGGDRRFEGVEEVWRAMARGIERGASGGGEPAAILMTLHPRGGDSSSTCFHDDDWLDFNMWQTGHSPINGRPPTWEKIARDYNRTPVKPVIDGEPLYEGIPIGFNRELYGHSTDAHVRQRAYWHVFAGACGHTYGHHSVWQMHSEKWPPLTFPILPWRQAIHCLGAQQMRHLKALILSRPYFSRVPDQTLIAGANPSDETHLQATRGDGYAFVYTPFGLPVAVRLGAISGGAVRAWWHNPRIGSAILIDTFDNRGTREFVPPSNGFGCDWTLVLDDASRDFPIPGAAE